MLKFKAINMQGARRPGPRRRAASRDAAGRGPVQGRARAFTGDELTTHAGLGACHARANVRAAWPRVVVDAVATFVGGAVAVFVDLRAVADLVARENDAFADRIQDARHAAL